MKLGLITEYAPSGEVDLSSPTENDLMVSRLIARIAELEERLYKKELEAPAVADRSTNSTRPSGSGLPIGSAQYGTPSSSQPQPSQSRLRDSFLATLRDSWAKFEATASTPLATAAGAAAVTPTATAAPSGAHFRATTPKQLGPSTSGEPSHARSQSAGDLQAVDFAAPTQLVVDYSRPNRGSASASGEGDPGGGGNEGGAQRSRDDDNDSLSSVGSGSMEYGVEASREREQELERRRLSSSGQDRNLDLRRASSSGQAAAGLAAAPPMTPTGDTAGRPPLPPAARTAPGGVSAPARNSCDGVLAAPAAAGSASAGNSGSGAAGPGPGSSAGAASRAAAWSGSMLSKLGLAWGRDRDGSRDGASRDVGRQVRGADAFNEKTFEEQLAAGGGFMGGGDGGKGGGQYYRYVFDPVDVQAEMEVTGRVRRAAAEALMEANAKLAEAQAAQEALKQQVEAAKELEQELASLRSEREALVAGREALAAEMAAVQRQVEGMKDTETSLQGELESMRSQADIWRSSKSDEAEKLKQENNLFRSQLNTRLSELSAARTRLSEGEAERQRLLRDIEELQNKVQWLTRINLQLEAAAAGLHDARKAAAEWQERFMRERDVRRRLHDNLQQLRGNIRVMCRVRPVQTGCRDIVTYPLEGLLAVSPPDKRYQEFEFDHAFSPATGQAAVFEEAVASLVRSAADGYNVCIFAYGQTGSGKTHTMQGPPSDPGIYVRALQELFRIAQEEGAAASSAPSPPRPALPPPAEDGSSDPAPPTASPSSSLGRYSFCVSMLEIYNEAVHDLLAPHEPGSSSPRSMDVSGLGAGELPPGVDRVPGLTWRPVSDTQAVEALLREGGRNRATAATSLNAHSSRSHALLSVRLTVGQAGGRQAVSHMHLVDLAGSERVDKSEVTGQQLKEAQCINRSLSALGDVISALQRRGAHIPFRNSKLTAVLQDSLCGNSKVLLVCNISPESTSASETLSSLNFASRAAQVELGAARRAAPQDRPAPAATPERPDRAGGAERERGALPSHPSPSPAPPPLPIMNGTAAKVRQQAAAAAAAGGGGGGGMRASHSQGALAGQGGGRG